MSIKHGVPSYDHEGRLKGVAYDHDGDGIYDDYEAVVSDPISSGDGYTVIGSDHDGDGVYDDTTFVVPANGTKESSSSPDRQTYYHHASKSSSSSGGQSFFSTKEKLKIGLIIFLALAALGIIFNLVVGGFSMVYAIFHLFFA